MTPPNGLLRYESASVKGFSCDSTYDWIKSVPSVGQEESMSAALARGMPVFVGRQELRKPFTYYATILAEI